MRSKQAPKTFFCFFFKNLFGHVSLPNMHCCVRLSASSWRVPCLMPRGWGEMGGWAPFQSAQQTTTMLQEVSATLRCNHLIWCSGGGRSQSGAWFGSLPGRLRTLWLLLPSARRTWSKSGQTFWCFWCFIRVSLGGLFASPVSLVGVGFWNL